METKNINDCDRANFTLSKAIFYQIKIAGRPGENWSDWLDNIELKTDIDSAGYATTTLFGVFDQAGLIGLLRQIYSMGYPLISVNCIQIPKR